MIETKTIEDLKKPYLHFKEGELAMDMENKKTYLYKNNEWVPFSQNNSINSGINLYDINKSIIGQKSPATEEELEEIKKELYNYHSNNDNTYYMLLCRERNYYTLFKKNITRNRKDDFFPTAILSCFDFIGEIIMAELSENTNVFEIWAKDSIDGEINCYHLFPYDEGVVNFN